MTGRRSRLLSIGMAALVSAACAGDPPLAPAARSPGVASDHGLLPSARCDNVEGAGTIFAVDPLSAEGPLSGSLTGTLTQTVTFPPPGGPPLGAHGKGAIHVATTSTFQGQIGAQPLAFTSEDVVLLGAVQSTGTGARRRLSAQLELATGASGFLKLQGWQYLEGGLPVSAEFDYRGRVCEP